MANPKGGPPKAFNSPAVFKKRMQEYLEYCKEEDRVPLLVGFARFCQIPILTLEGYKHREGFQGLYAMIKDATHDEIIQRGMDKSADSRFSMFMLRNHQKYDAIDSEDTRVAPQTIEIVLAKPD